MPPTCMPIGNPARRCLVDRPVAAATERFAGARRQQHLDEPAVVRAALDFLDRGLRDLRSDQDRAAQPRLLVEPVATCHSFDGARHRGADTRCCVGRRATQRNEDADLHAVEIKMLRAHEVEVGAGRRAVRRPGIAARDVRCHARIGQGFRQRLPQMVGIGLHVLAPALRQERQQLGAAIASADGCRSRPPTGWLPGE